MKGAMCSTRVGLWVEEVNLNGECIILVQAGVSVVHSLLMSSMFKRSSVVLNRVHHSVVILNAYIDKMSKVVSPVKTSSRPPPAVRIPDPTNGIQD